MAYEGIREDSDFNLRREPPSWSAIGNVAKTTGTVGAVAGLTPALLRLILGGKFKPGRTALEVGAGASLGALLPALSRMRRTYQGPTGEVRSWQDVQQQAGLPVTYRPGEFRKHSAHEKQALAPLMAVPFALKGLGYAFAAWQANNARKAYMESRALRRSGMHDEANKLRNSAIIQGVTAPMYVLPYGRMLGWAGRIPWVARAGNAAVGAAKAIPGAGHIARGAKAAVGAFRHKPVVNPGGAFSPGFAGRMGQRALNTGRGFAKLTASSLPGSIADDAAGRLQNQAYSSVGRRVIGQAHQPQAVNWGSPAGQPSTNPGWTSGIGNKAVHHGGRHAFR